MAPSKEFSVRSRRRSLRSRTPYLMLAGMALAPACGGSGGCSSCGGIAPLPGGFINEERIENAASVRITQSGFDFLEDNLGALAGNLLGDAAGQGGVVTFPVPESQGAFDVPIPFVPDVDYTVCPGGPDATANPPKCVAEIDIGNADLSMQPAGPHNIQVSGLVPLRLQYLPFDSDIGGMEIVLNGNDSCPGDNQTFAPINVSIDISVETDQDPAHARQGYSRVRINAVNINQGDIEDAIKLDCSGFLGTIADLLKGLLVGQLFGSLQDTLVSSIEEQLCQAANPAVDPACPTGTNDVEGICRYGTTPDSECVSIVLGTDGRANLSGLLQGISPGTKGGMDFLFAAGGQSPRDDGSGQTWGDLNPTNNGATLGMMGGVEPFPGPSGCVPLSNAVRPSGLKIPNELINDSLVASTWPANVPGPHLGLGVSESFFNYALAGMYDSGLLCIGLSTETVDLLNSGTLGVLAQSLRDLGIQQETQPIAIVLKPKTPPRVTFGNGTNLTTDPLIRLQLEQAGFDFYVFSSDRFVRFMSAEFDIDAPVNLTVTPDGLVPVLDELGITNGTVSNTELLKEDPATLAALLESLLSSQIGSLLGSGLPAIDLNGALESLGLRLVIPETVEGQGSPGLRTLEKDGERYLGIFAAFEVAPAMQMSMVTSAELVEADVDQAGLRAETITPTNAPKITILAEVLDDQGQVVEHQVRVDGGMWKPWTRDRYIHVTGDELRIEGRHVFEVRSRLAGQPYSVDDEPAVVEVLIDTVAPAVTVAEDAEGLLAITPKDLVSDDELLVRYRFDEGSWSPWIRKADLTLIDPPEYAEAIEVETKDESGNLGTSQQALIRGLPRADGEGCGCAVPGERSRTPGALLLVALGSVLAMLRRRRPRATEPARKTPTPRRHAVEVGRRSLASRTLLASIVALGLTSSFGGCSCDDDTTDETDPPKPGDCKAPDCVTLEPGLIGAYTSADFDSKDVLWVAGYNEGNYESAFPKYGDLAVGQLVADRVEWEVIDGVPSTPEVDPKKFNVFGFRGGQTEAGEDVGIWTSLALNGDDAPAIAYFDRTNTQLKFAERKGDSWEISVVDGAADTDTGRYAKLVYVNGTPLIAYQAIESTASGRLVSKVKLATGVSNGFTLEDVAQNAETPCRNGFCTGGSVCAADAGVCAAAAAGCDSCDAGAACLDVGNGPECQVTLTAQKIEPYPVATGLYIAAAPDPESGSVGIAFYDRVAGTLNIARKSEGSWTTEVVDGGVLPDGTASDVGVGASLFISSDGTWHLTYVDGYAESLKYAVISNGNVELDVIDDGLSVNGVPFPDGQHVIGDDSNVSVVQGAVTVTYQDATSGDLRIAERQGPGEWNLRVVETGYFGGFFSKQLPDGRVLSWGRRVEADDTGLKRSLGDVTVVTP